MIVLILLAIIWIPATVATYKTLRPVDPEELPFTLAVGSFIFWWLMLPVILSVLAFRAGGYHFNRLQEARTARQRAFRSGTENGLYEETK